MEVAQIRHGQDCDLGPQLCVGPHHVEEIRRREEMTLRLIEFGRRVEVGAREIARIADERAGIGSMGPRR